MRWRKILLKCFYYFLLVSVTLTFFLFISTFGDELSKYQDWHMGAHEYDENVVAAKVFYGFALLYHMASLLLAIVFWRKEPNISNRWFILLSILFFVFAILPALYVLIGVMFYGSMA